MPTTETMIALKKAGAQGAEGFSVRESSGTTELYIDNVKVLDVQQSAIVSLTDSTTGTAGDTIDDSTASVKDDLASLGAKINAILTVLRAHGLIAT